MVSTQFDSSQTSQFSNTFLGLGRNRIINGEMMIDQVNGGNSFNISSVFLGTLDMWLGLAQGSGAISITRSTATPPTGFTHFMRAACTTADPSITTTDIYGIQARIEGYSLRDFLLGTANAKTFTLSFWVRSDLTGTYCTAIQSSAGSRTYLSEYTINSANTWEYKTITVPGDITGTWNGSTNLGMRVNWALAVGPSNQGTPGSWTAAGLYATSNQVNFMSTNSGRTFDLTGVQLELGSSATPFEYRPFQQELELCQRYYEKTYSFDVAPGTNTGIGHFAMNLSTHLDGSIDTYQQYAVTKRASPTILLYTDSGTAGSWNYNRSGAAGTITAAGADIGTHGFRARLDPVGANWVVCEAAGHWVADARL